MTSAPSVLPLAVLDFVGIEHGETPAEAIRGAWEEGGELAGVVELRRHFPLIADNANARLCVRTIVGWRPVPRSAPDQERPSG